MVKKLIRYSRVRLKHIFDNIENQRLKRSMLQAVPFWIASFLTGVAAVMYAKIFEWAENLLQLMLKWNALSIFAAAPAAFVLSWWLVQKYAPYAKGSGIPQVMAAVDLATPGQRHKLRFLLSFKIVLIKVLSSTVLVLRWWRRGGPRGTHHSDCGFRFQVCKPVTAKLVAEDFHPKHDYDRRSGRACGGFQHAYGRNRFRGGGTRQNPS